MWRRWPVAAALLALTVAAWLSQRPDGVDRIAHPARYATTGGALLPLPAYLATAARSLGPGARIGGIVLPGRDGDPVTLTASRGVRHAPAVELFLDPPTARLLAQVPQEQRVNLRAAPALSPELAVERARTIAPGRLMSIDWPTAANADWTLRFTRRAGAAHIVKVADDTGGATVVPARDQRDVASLLRRLGGDAAGEYQWRAALYLGVPVLLIAVAGAMLWRRGRRRPAGRQRFR